jgi:hypothetical protein
VRIGVVVLAFGLTTIPVSPIASADPQQPGAPKVATPTPMAGSGQQAATTQGKPRQSELSRPCVSEPEPGFLLEVTVESRVAVEGKEFRYSWNVACAKSSRAALKQVGFSMSDVRLSGPSAWKYFPDERGLGETLARGGHSYTVSAIAWSEEADLRPGESCRLECVSGKLPGVVDARFTPRRDPACLPSTPEEEKALAAAGWTEERLGREWNALTSPLKFIDWRAVVGPLFEPEFLPVVGPEGLFAWSMDYLGRLEDWVTYGPDSKEMKVVPPGSVQKEIVRALESLEAIRDRALSRKTFMEKHRQVVLTLYDFYRRIRDERGAPPK